MNKRDFEKCIETFLEENRENKFSKENAEKLFNDVKSFFPVNKLPFPILVKNIHVKKTRSNYTKAKNLIYDNKFQYYINPVTGKRYNSYNEAQNDIKKPLAIFESDYHLTETFYKYIKELDCIVFFDFEPSKNIYDINNFGFIFRLNSEIKKPIVYFKKSGDDFKSFAYRSTYDVHYCYNSNIFYGPYGSKESYAKALYKLYGTTIYRLCANDYASLAFSAPDERGISNITKKTSKKQKIIDELAAITLPKIPIKTIPGIKQLRRNKPLVSVTSICHVKEDVSVLRWTNYSEITKEQSDGLRIYLVKDKYYSCVRNLEGEYVEYDVSKIAMDNFISDYMLDIKSEDVKGTNFCYYSDVINTLPNDKRSVMLLACIKNPCLERLAKVGLENLVLKLIYQSNTKNDFNKNIEKIFIDSKIPNINKALGLNKNQIKIFAKKIEEQNPFSYRRDYFSTLRNIRESILFDDDLSHFDDNTFSNALNMANADYYLGEFQEICKILYDKNKDLHKHFVNNISPEFFKVENRYGIRTYRDYISMVNLMDMFDKFKIGIYEENELNSAHDIVSTLYNMKKSEYELKAFTNNVKKVQKYEYSPAKSDFVVIAPTKPEDVAQEGIELRHCVKSYIPKIASGKTNIMFIRKKDDVSKPFFTVEVSNDGCIEQVHGFANRNANTEKGLTEFVEKWAKNVKLTTNTINKIR